jgi:uncharacterized protein with HEPN domain
MADDVATVLDIVLACRRIAQFLTETDEAHFLAAEEKHRAVLSQLSIIGEAVRRLSDEFRDTRPSIPWREIAGMRDRLIHAYDKINWSIVWRTAAGDIPVPLRNLETFLPRRDDGPENQEESVH